MEEVRVDHASVSCSRFRIQTTMPINRTLFLARFCHSSLTLNTKTNIKRYVCFRFLVLKRRCAPEFILYYSRLEFHM